MKRRVVLPLFLVLFFVFPELRSARSGDALVDRTLTSIQDQLISLRRELHAHPELSNREIRTAKVVAQYLRELGLEVATDVAKTGVVALLRGRKASPVVAVRADMDALPIHEATDLPYASKNAGVMHACGHDLHMTVALGAAHVLSVQSSRLPGSVKFLFQPAEEGAPPGEDGGASLMVREGVLKNPAVSAIFGLHSWPQLPVGTIGLRAGPTLASSDRFEIVILGKKTHGAYPQSGVDAIVVAAQVVTALQTIPSRQIDTRDPVVLSVGIIEGGNRFNIIADRVRLVGTVRTLDPSIREEMPARIEQVVRGITQSAGARYLLDYQNNTPVTVNDVGLLEQMRPSFERMTGAIQIVQVRATMGAEDFAFYANEIPGLYFFLGVANREASIGSMLHTPNFMIDERAIALGVRVMTQLVSDYLAAH